MNREILMQKREDFDSSAKLSAEEGKRAAEQMHIPESPVKAAADIQIRPCFIPRDT